MNTAFKLIVSIAIPLTVAGLSGYATARGVADWYPTLEKPGFNPPSWVFGPVWTVLYVMMGVAVFVIWKKGIHADGVKLALTVFAVQLALNGLWSILFFGLRAPGWALMEIVLLWTAIGGTILLFKRVDPVAAWLLAPYWLWVSFASLLNASLWWLNRPLTG